MTLWLIFALMTAAAIFAVLWPLAQRRDAPPGGSDIAVYRDQLDEIARDRTAGLIGAAEAEAAEVEVSRRLIAAADKADSGSATGAAGNTLRRRIAAAAALVALPLGAGALYLTLGSPSLPGQPLALRQQLPTEHASIVQLIQKIESHLEQNPQDGRGWEVVAPVYMRLGRFEDAVKARRNALRLNGETVERQSDLGEALTAANNGIVTAEARAAFERAAALDAKAVKATFYLGVAAEQDGRREDAARIWRGLIAGAPKDAPWIEFVRQALARVEGGAVAGARGPNEADVKAADQMTEEQRTEMIRGMVARLAERLKQDGSDLEGWLRLVRAYMVMGDRDKALAAAADARRALAGDPEKLQRLEELVKGLGLAG